MPHTILVADDDPHIREIICFALEKAGMKTLGVADGAAALQAVERRAPDLIVLDIGGLEMGGDDYVTKPFSPRELVARVNVILRRARPVAVEEEADDRQFAHGKLM